MFSCRNDVSCTPNSEESNLCLQIIPKDTQHSNHKTRMLTISTKKWILLANITVTHPGNRALPRDARWTPGPSIAPMCRALTKTPDLKRDLSQVAHHMYGISNIFP